MKIIPVLLLCIIFISAIVSAHTLERKVITKSDGTYNVQFTSEPEYPIKGKKTHFDFEVWDNAGQLLTGLSFAVEMQKPRGTLVINSVETEPAHYSVEYLPDEFGVYLLSPIINNEKIDITFDIYIDTFWPKGMTTLGTIAVLLFILLMLMYRDCRDKKIKRRKALKK